MISCVALGRPRDRAAQLRLANTVVQRGQRPSAPRRSAAPPAGPVDRAAIEPRRCTGLEPPLPQPDLANLRAPTAPTRVRHGARLRSPARQRTCEHRGRCRSRSPRRGTAAAPSLVSDADDPATANHQPKRLRDDQLDAALTQQLSHRGTIEPRSAWTRGPHTAGPLLRLSIRRWIAA